MTDADAFLDAIFAYPENDLPRLVYADWLEEHGQEAYGEFIRLQCAIDPLPNDHPNRLPLRRREKEVWAAVKGRWPEFFRATKVGKDWFRRGFITRNLVLPSDVFAAHSTVWWPWFPVPRLDLQVAAGDWSAVLGCDYLDGVPT
jgi:uncharacterized protein (TIGR02996 family)